MVIFNRFCSVGKRTSYIDFGTVFIFVIPISYFAFRLPKLYGGKRIFPCNFFYMVYNTVLITKILSFQTDCLLDCGNTKSNAVIDNRLAFDDIQEIFYRYMNVCKDFQVGFPANTGSCILFCVRFFLILLHFHLFQSEAGIEHRPCGYLHPYIPTHIV